MSETELSEMEKLACWMISEGFATGHGDTLNDLLGGLSWQIKERLAAKDALIAELRAENERLKENGTPVNGSTSDGYHTFDELYAHRIALWIALCQATVNNSALGFVWRSRLHSDGSKFDGWFVLGIGYKRGEQITYHLPESSWDKCAFARTLPRAPDFDGHSAKDVLSRIPALGNSLELATETSKQNLIDSQQVLIAELVTELAQWKRTGFDSPEEMIGVMAGLHDVANGRTKSIEDIRAARSALSE